MRKVIAIVFAVVLTITATSCKKETALNPISAISQMDNKILKVESIKVGEIEISQYVISNFAYNAALPTIFEMKISNGGTSILYKTMESWQIETAKVLETKSGMLNIQFTDNNPNGIGYQNQVYIPQELIDKKIVTFQQNNGGYNAYYICSSEVLNGNYTVEKKDNRFVMTRSEEPVITIMLVEK